MPALLSPVILNEPCLLLSLLYYKGSQSFGVLLYALCLMSLICMGGCSAAGRFVTKNSLEPLLTKKSDFD
jgi:hypothetical protein